MDYSTHDVGNNGLLNGKKQNIKEYLSYILKNLIPVE